MSLRASLNVCALMLTMLSAGCAHTTIETARQLESGQVVAGGALDWPGSEVWPRASGYGKVGLADLGDLGLVSAYDGEALTLGGSARAYLGERWMAGLQVNFERYLWWTRDTDERPSPLADVVLITPRLSTTVREQAGVYVGVQGTLNGNWRYSSDEATSPTFRVWILRAGGFLGAEREFASGWSVQAEMILLPLNMSVSGDFYTIDAFETEMLFQGSLGASYRFGGGQEEVERPTPTRAEPEEGPASNPAPERDGSGVPIY